VDPDSGVTSRKQADVRIVLDLGFLQRPSPRGPRRGDLPANVAGTVNWDVIERDRHVRDARVRGSSAYIPKFAIARTTSRRNIVMAMTISTLARIERYRRLKGEHKNT
jgi:hypothetical protein